MRKAKEHVKSETVIQPDYRTAVPKVPHQKSGVREIQVPSTEWASLGEVQGQIFQPRSVEYMTRTSVLAWKLPEPARAVPTLTIVHKRNPEGGIVDMPRGEVDAPEA